MQNKLNRTISILILFIILMNSKGLNAIKADNNDRNKKTTNENNKQNIKITNYDGEEDKIKLVIMVVERTVNKLHNSYKDNLKNISLQEYEIKRSDLKYINIKNIDGLRRKLKKYCMSGEKIDTYYESNTDNIYDVLIFEFIVDKNEKLNAEIEINGEKLENENDIEYYKTKIYDFLDKKGKENDKIGNTIICIGVIIELLLIVLFVFIYIHNYIKERKQK